MISLVERLDKNAKKKKKGHSQDANDKLRLSKTPLNNNGKDLPSAKSWNNWRTVKLHNWAAMQKSGFEKIVKKRINMGLSESNKKRYSKQIKQLDCEICQPMDEDLSVWIEDVEKTDGIALLQRLHGVITQTSTERVAALHERFAA